MESQQLRNHLAKHLAEIQRYIHDFERRMIDSQDTYQKVLESLTTPELRSSLMEKHVIHTERQKLCMARMEALYERIRDRLASLCAHNV